MQAEPGLTIERRSGTRAATTLRNEPRARPGASASAANVTSARARQADRGRRIRRDVLRLALRPVLLVLLERHRYERGAGVDELRARSRRLRDDDVRRIAGHAALDLPGKACILELTLGEDERLAPHVRHDDRDGGGRQPLGAGRHIRQLAPGGGEADRRHGEGAEDGGDEQEPAHTVLFGRSQPRLKRTTGAGAAGWTTWKTRFPAAGAAVATSAAPTTAGVRRAPVVGASFQVNAVPAKAWNQASCWGHAVAGWSCRWRCGPVASPVAPTRPTCWPVVSLAPATTAGSMTARWQYVHVWPSSVWKVRPMPHFGSGWLQARRTTASLIAYTGEPSGAAMSTAG